MAEILSVAAAMWGQTGAGEHDHGAGVARADEITYPVNCQLKGGVTLEVSVDGSGGMQDVRGVVDGDFRPAQGMSAKYAMYPASRMMSDTVLLDARVGGDGKLVGVSGCGNGCAVRS